jgi:hypothetical protein
MSSMAVTKSSEIRAGGAEQLNPSHLRPNRQPGDLTLHDECKIDPNITTNLAIGFSEH